MEGDRGEGDRDEGDRGEGDRDEGDRGEGDRDEGDRGEEDRGDEVRDEGDRGEEDRGDEVRDEGDRGEEDRGDEGDRGEEVRGDEVRGDEVRDEGDRGEEERGEEARGEGDRGEEARGEGDRDEGDRGEEDRVEEDRVEEDRVEEDRVEEDRVEEDRVEEDRGDGDRDEGDRGDEDRGDGDRDGDRGVEYRGIGDRDEGDRGVRYFITEVIRMLRSRHRVFEDIPIESVEPSEEVSRTLIENMSKVVFMHSFSSRAKWHPYLKNHQERMTVSWKVYLQYIVYAYYCMNDGIYEVYERLVSIMSVATTIETFFCNRDHKEFLRHTIDVLCKFFEIEVAKNFFVGGGWTELDAFLRGNAYLPLYDEEYRPMSKAEVDRANDRLRSLLSKFVKNFIPENLEADEIENHEPTKLMVARVLERP